MMRDAEANIKAGNAMDSRDLFEMMKFYDESAAKAKEQIWMVTSWLLALNAGIIAYSVKFYLAHKAERLGNSAASASFLHRPPSGDRRSLSSRPDKV